MPQDKSQPTPEEIYYAAEKYLPYLADELREPIAALLAEARAGHKRDTAILSLISEDAAARKWMRAALFGEQLTLRGGYQPLAGSGPTSVPASSLWVCSKCGYPWRVQRKGRPVPPCPKDGSVLVQVKESPQKEGA